MKLKEWCWSATGKNQVVTTYGKTVYKSNDYGLTYKKCEKDKKEK